MEGTRKKPQIKDGFYIELSKNKFLQEAGTFAPTFLIYS